MKKYYPLLLLGVALSLPFFNLNATVTTCDPGCACKVFVPNAFSPNEDGRNDTFLPYANCVVTNYNLKIFNRWGKLVFESDAIDKGWDGKANGEQVQPDVFVYIITFSYAEDEAQKEEILSGDVALLR